MKILIAEDNFFLRAAVKKLLLKNYPDALVEEAVNGTALLIKALAKDGNWDLVIANIATTGLAGIEIAETLREIGHLKILIVSATDEKDYAKFSFLNNVAGFIKNSNLSEELTKAVNALLVGENYFPGRAKTISLFQQQLSIAS